MTRKIEKRILLSAGIWNIFTAALTIFGYSLWFKQQGVDKFASKKLVSYFTTSMLDSLILMIMIFGLVMLAIGIISIFWARRIQDFEIDKKLMTYLACCIVFHLICFDVIGVLLYLVTLVIYTARNKSIKFGQLNEG